MFGTGVEAVPVPARQETLTAIPVHAKNGPAETFLPSTVVQLRDHRPRGIPCGEGNRLDSWAAARRLAAGDGFARVGFIDRARSVLLAPTLHKIHGKLALVQFGVIGTM